MAALLQARLPWSSYLATTQNMNFEILITALGWWLGGFVNGVAGFGAALVAMPIVASGLDMPLALTSCTMVVLALNVQMTWIYRQHLSCAGFRGILLGGIPGAIIGILMLRYLPEAGLKIGLGCLLVVYSLWGLWWKMPQPKKLPERWAVLAGFLSTSLGAAFGINGPSLAAYLAAKGSEVREFKATLGAFFIASCLLIMLAHGVAGMYSLHSVSLFALALPAVLCGGWIGLRVSGGIKKSVFQILVYSMLIIAGIKMILPPFTYH